MLENFRDLRKFLNDHHYPSDFIEGIRSHHEEAKSAKWKDRKIFLGARFKPALLNHTLRELRVLRGLPNFHLVAALPRWVLCGKTL